MDTAPDRRDELLADEAIFGLAADERTELDRLIDGDAAEPSDYDRAAAAYYLAAATIEPSPLPSELMDKLRDQAKPFERHVTPLVTSTEPDKLRGWNQAFWLAALAASLLIGVSIGSRLDTPNGAAGPLVDLQAARTALLADEPELTRVAWTVGDDRSVTEQATGEVVWSDSRQQGFMSFKGLAANDPSVEQYQLWIFDADRDDRYPVDGGVFDIPADSPTAEGEVIVPISAKIPVSKAVLFAITVEKPGGVVVSDRSRLPLLAKVN